MVLWPLCVNIYEKEIQNDIMQLDFGNIESIFKRILLTAFNTN